MFKLGVHLHPAMGQGGKVFLSITFTSNAGVWSVKVFAAAGAEDV